MMPVVSASVDAFVATAIAVTIPTFMFLRRRQSTSQSPYRNWLTLLVTLHTVYIVYVLIVQWPPNLFQRLNIPLTMPVDGIRTILLQRANLPSDATLPKALEGLLTRLSSFDTRIAYVRFGQLVLQDCQHCKTVDQYALYAFPGPLTQYIREAALLGLLTTAPSHRPNWRTHVIVALVVACILECYSAVMAGINIPRDGLNVFMLHDTLWLARHVLFLSLPIVTHALPHTTPSPPPFTTILATRVTLERVLKRTTFLKLLHSAVARQPELHQRSSKWWSDKRQVGEQVRTDEAVKVLADRLGVGFREGGEDQNEGSLRTRARQLAAELTSAALVQVPPESAR